MAKSEYWLKMAEEDLKDASLDIENSRFPSSVFHSQQCAEKVCKAILSSLGIESGKTHFPSSVLELMVMRGNKFQLSRHGWETVDKIIMPSEIYDANKAGALFSNAKEVMELGRKFLTKSK
jgi:HEPN domain-containing protein